METGDQYGLPDLRRLLARRTYFQTTTQQQPTTEPYFVPRNIEPLPHHQPQENNSFMLSGNGQLLFPNGGLLRFGHDHLGGGGGASPTRDMTSATATTSAAAVVSSLYGVEMENGWSFGNNDGGSSRWPRQETLTLLEIRSRLDSKFKEANQKGPIWDEVSRIMAEEHGYQRSGKKCREKFENLYKYYKKTKEGKAGRQDGKNYRFFRQLEALYGETNNQLSSSETNPAQQTLLCQTSNYNPISNPENQESLLQERKQNDDCSLSFTNTSDFETSSSENNDDLHHDLSNITSFMMKAESMEKQKRIIGSQSYDKMRIRNSWKAKVKAFVEKQMNRLMETQEAWMERMLKIIEDREQERMCKEEEWRKQEAARLDREHEFWARERAWFEARDTAIMEAFKKFTGKGPEEVGVAAIESSSHNKKQLDCRWSEAEISSLIQLRSSLESRFREYGHSNRRLWKEIEAKMVSLGYDRDAIECKQKWDNIYNNNKHIYLSMSTAAEEGNKKRKEDLRSSSNYFHQPLDPSYDGQQQKHDHQITMDSPSNSYAGTKVHDECTNNAFHIVVDDEGENLWDRFGLKLVSDEGKNDQQV